MTPSIILHTKVTLYTLCACLILAACGGRHGGTHAERHTGNWLQTGEWRQGWKLQADSSLDSAEFASRYRANPERWQKAFSFLANTDLVSQAPGRYELDGEHLFAIILEYEPKDEADTRFEAHRKYADIQYVIKGRERIGLVPLATTELIEPYDEAQDIAFFQSNTNNYQNATPEHFFIFFPDDAHRPGVRVNEGEPVKKIVIKVGL